MRVGLLERSARRWQLVALRHICDVLGQVDAVVMERFRALVRAARACGRRPRDGVFVRGVARPGGVVGAAMGGGRALAAGAARGLAAGLPDPQGVGLPAIHALHPIGPAAANGTVQAARPPRAARTPRSDRSSRSWRRRRRLEVFAALQGLDATSRCLSDDAPSKAAGSLLSRGSRCGAGRQYFWVTGGSGDLRFGCRRLEHGRPGRSLRRVGARRRGCAVHDGDGRGGCRGSSACHEVEWPHLQDAHVARA